MEDPRPRDWGQITLYAIIVCGVFVLNSDADIFAPQINICYFDCNS